MKPFFFACLFLSAAGQLSAQVISYGLFKAGYYLQTSEAAPVLEPSDNHYFQAFVEVGPDEVSRATVRPPSGMQLNLLPLFFYSEAFSSQAAMDNKFRAGTYGFTVNSDFEDFSAQLSLGGTYPSIPKVANHAALQAIDPSKEFTVTWAAFVGGTADDAIGLAIYGEAEKPLFATPEQGEKGALGGTATSAVIPAGTLAPSRAYTGYLTFTKYSQIDFSSGAFGLAEILRETSVSLKTGAAVIAGPPRLVMLPRQADGSLQLELSGTVGTKFILQASQDLRAWETVLTDSLATPKTILTDKTTPARPLRLYRLQVE